jgi:replicative DNA helicase
MTKTTPKDISAEVLFLEKDSNAKEYQKAPYNIDAEQLVLGAVLTNNEALNHIGDFLRNEHFYEPIHQKIFEAIQHFAEKGIVATPITLKNYFDQDEELKEIGGSKYLVKLATMASALINVVDYSHVIYDLYLKRQLLDLGSEMVHSACDHKLDNSAQEQIEHAEQSLFNLSASGNVGGDFEGLNVSLNKAIQRAEAAHKNKGTSGVPTLLTDLDRLLGGLQDSDLLILAGRPSMGKTALAINIAYNAAEHFAKEKIEEGKKRKSVGFFSLEMSSDQLASRMIAMVSKVNSHKFRTGGLNNDDFSEIVKANKILAEVPFFIDDTPALSISAVRTRARRLKRKHNLALLVIDYLQLLRGSNKNSENRVQEVSEITQGLKAIAKELDIPVIALSQLSRAVEQRDDKRPQLSDLRESGSIEQDSDIVMFIFREQYYIERKKPSEGSTDMAAWQTEMERVFNKAEVIVAKQRNGAVGNVNIYFDPSTTKFTDLAKEY